MPSPFIDIWINCPDRETAEKVAAICVEKRLAACANIFAPIASLYHWKGKVESEQEVPLVLKTRAALFDAVCEAVRATHPYEVPSIVATYLVAVDKDYATWLEDETSPG